MSSKAPSEVHKILEKLVTELLVKKPEDPVPYMLHVLEDMKGVGEKPLDPEERGELDKLRKEHAKLKQQTAGKEEHKKAADSSDDSEEEEDIGSLPDQPVGRISKAGPRISVSAEAYGRFNKKGDFQPIVIAKNEETKKKLHDILYKTFMLRNLDENEALIVVDAMEEYKVKAGETVIKEGEKGDELFVVESGSLDCFINIDGQSKQVKTYAENEAFGELALLYNAPRAATITAKTDCQLWTLDRNTFNHIVKDAASRKRDKYEEFLKSVTVLSSLDHYQRAKLADAIKEDKFKKDEFVIKQGENGDVFYIISEGEAVATKSVDGGAPVEVMKYKVADYFGELALLKNEPRAANILAKSDVLKVVSLDRNSFQRLLGPLDEILKRNMAAYQDYC